MNERNTELFFGDEENNVIITLTDEDGKDTDVMLIASFEIEEMGTEYIIAVEMDETGEGLTEDMQLLKYEEDLDGEPEIGSIDDEEEYALAAQACKEILKSGAIEGFSVEEEEEEDENDYLRDLGTIFPGISIDKGQDF
jgi:uncharacterized protein YrzB (UPF0473 family)